MKLMIDIDAVGWNDVAMGYMPGSKALLMGVSAEEVIPCKDCKHWFYFWESEKHHCTESDKHPWDCPIREADDFCSRGERKDEID